MSTNKTTDNVVADIYALMESKDADPSVDVEAEIEKFGEGVKALMRTEFGRKKREDNRKLRLSNIGRTDKCVREGDRAAAWHARSPANRGARKR